MRDRQSIASTDRYKFCIVQYSTVPVVYLSLQCAVLSAFL